MHPHHPERERVARREAAQPKKRGSDGDSGLLREGEELLTRFRGDDAVACEDDRAFRGVDQRDRACDVARLAGPAGGSTPSKSGAVLPGEDSHALLRVLGDVDEDRTGPSGSCDLEGFAQGRADLARVRDEVVVLRDRERHAGDVGLLEGVAAEERRRTWPVMQTIGDESSIAVAIPVTRFVAPGPDVASATPTLPDARAYPSAMWAAPCSWRTRTWRTRRRRAWRRTRA